jgi:hypothetical protein
MAKHLGFFLILALSLGIVMWVVKQAQTQMVLGASTDVEIEAIEKEIEGL